VDCILDFLEIQIATDAPDDYNLESLSKWLIFKRAGPFDGLKVGVFCGCPI